MRFAMRSVLLATTCLVLTSHALPRPAPPAYSVVNVDGQSTPATPTTIVKTITDESESTVTTTLEGPTHVGPTSYVTLTTDLNPQATDTYMVPEVSGYVVATSYTVIHSTSDVPVLTTVTDYMTAYTTIKPSSASDTTDYYDDGMWHTSYEIKTPATAVPKASYGPYKIDVAAGNGASGPTGFKLAVRAVTGTGLAIAPLVRPTGY